MEQLADRLAQVPGVVAVALVGSRALGEERPESDWDFCLYYRKRLEVEPLRALGEGEVAEPGAFGPVLDGAARLIVSGQRVDILYRDLTAAERWLEEAREGRFEIAHAPGLVAGFPTYALAAELALGKVLLGELPRPEFPEALKEAAPGRWRGQAAIALDAAETVAQRVNVSACAGLLARAALAEAQGRHAERGEWVAGERGILRRAGLGEADIILAMPGADPFELERSARRMRLALGIRG